MLFAFFGFILSLSLFPFASTNVYKLIQISGKNNNRTTTHRLRCKVMNKNRQKTDPVKKILKYLKILPPSLEKNQKSNKLHLPKGNDTLV